MIHAQPIDVLIIGGGMAGLWLLDELHRAGYAALLVERDALGTGQTIASQGILHSGMKHALAGRVGGFVDALRDMQDHWITCLQGTRDPCLDAVQLRGTYLHCWRTGSITGFLGMFGARAALRSGLSLIPATDRPLPLQQCPGDVYRLDEPVVDPASLLGAFMVRNRAHVIRTRNVHPVQNASGTIIAVHLEHPDGQRRVTVKPRTVLLTAGEGNEALRAACGLPSVRMQRIPLPILVMRGPLPLLNGFCIDGTRAKAVITTQRVTERENVWQVASENVPPETSRGSFLIAALRQLEEALSGWRIPNCAVDAYVALRAEGVTDHGSRPDDVCIHEDGNIITAWPTKLVLVPRLADRIREMLPAPETGTDVAAHFRAWPRPSIAPYPWDAPSQPSR